MSSISKAGTFSLGTRTVKRMGYGAMQLAGPGVFGPPKGPRRRDRRSFARPSRAASITSTRATSMVRTSPTSSSRSASPLSR